MIANTPSRTSATSINPGPRELSCIIAMTVKQRSAAALENKSLNVRSTLPLPCETKLACICQCSWNQVKAEATEISRVTVDAPRGFEPRLTESESVVLPLDDGAAWKAAG